MKYIKYSMILNYKGNGDNGCVQLFPKIYRPSSSEYYVCSIDIEHCCVVIFR